MLLNAGLCCCNLVVYFLYVQDVYACQAALAVLIEEGFVLRRVFVVLETVFLLLDCVVVQGGDQLVKALNERGKIVQF